MNRKRQRSLVRALTVSLLLLSSAGIASASEPLVLRDMEGKVHDTDALVASGRSVVLVFWQTWCTSCKREAPELARAVSAHSGEIDFFGVVSGPDRSVDDVKVRKVAAQWGFSHPQVRDRDLSLTKRFKVFGTPVILVLGAEGRELYRGYRLPEDWTAYQGDASRGGESSPSS